MHVSHPVTLASRCEAVTQHSGLKAIGGSGYPCIVVIEYLCGFVGFSWEGEMYCRPLKVCHHSCHHTRYTDCLWVPELNSMATSGAYNQLDFHVNFFCLVWKLLRETTALPSGPCSTLAVWKLLRETSICSMYVEVW